MEKPQSLYDKIWRDHIIHETEDGTALIYIDRHLIHEVTTPQAFTELRDKNRPVRRPDRTLAVPDHNVATTRRTTAAGSPIPPSDPASAEQLRALEQNCNDFGIDLIAITDPRQGIVHVVGPEQGFTLPGTTVVCGDSHTATHGAFGALAFGIGTSEVHHVFATQTLLLRKLKNMRVYVQGALGFSITAKDLIMDIIGQIGASGGNGSVIEYCGPAIEALSMEGRMTLCNMSIEAGARAGLVAPDRKTYDYLKGRPKSPTGEMWEIARQHWQQHLFSDEGARFDHTVTIDADRIAPKVTWGTSPEDVVAITDCVPNPNDFADDARREAAEKSLDYMDLKPGTPMSNIAVSHVFIGSCTNSRIEDLRAAAKVVKGRKVSDQITQALVVPGSGLIKAQAEQEGLDHCFKEAGFEWREAGCSMCLAMNADKVPPGGRCASTSNRNFVNRQGSGARTHLMSPAMAAAAAINGRLHDVRDMEIQKP